MKEGILNFKKYTKLFNKSRKEYEPLENKLHKLRPDLTPQTIRQILMNNQAYLRLHPDVRIAMVDPLHHYLRNGFKEQRQTGVILLKKQEKHKHVAELAKRCYISMGAAADNASCKYRCIFPAMQSNCAVLTPQWSLEQILQHIFTCQNVTFLRPHTDKDLYLLTLCRNLGLDITIDYDDLLFPDIHHETGYSS